MNVTHAEREGLELESPRPALKLLGGFSVSVDGAPLDVRESSQRVIAFLALNERPQARHVVAGQLWPDSSEARATANLRSALWRIRDHRDRPRIVEARGNVLTVADAVDVDVRRVEAVGWSLVRDPTATVGADQGRLFFDELLPGWYEDWVLLERERLAQLRMHFLDATISALLRGGHIAEALDVAVRLVAFDPLRERSQRALLTVYRAEGSFGQAARQFERYRSLMWETFGCEPSPELTALARGVTDDRRAVPDPVTA